MKISFNLNFKLLLLFTLVFLTAFTAHNYSLIFSHLMSLSYGSFYLNFAFGTSLSILFLGLGTSVSLKIKNSISYLIFIEAVISIIGVLSFYNVELLSNYFFISSGLLLTISFLCGLELPLISELTEGYKSGKNIQNVLIFDYGGMILSALLFSFVLVRQFGISVTLIITASINFLCLFFLGLLKWAR